MEDIPPDSSTQFPAKNPQQFLRSNQGLIKLVFNRQLLGAKP
jgi:hypothetical protein